MRGKGAHRKTFWKEGLRWYKAFSSWLTANAHYPNLIHTSTPKITTEMGAENPTAGDKKKKKSILGPLLTSGPFNQEIEEFE